MPSRLSHWSSGGKGLCVMCECGPIESFKCSVDYLSVYILIFTFSVLVHFPGEKSCCDSQLWRPSRIRLSNLPPQRECRMSVLIVDDINYWRCTILRRLWPELIPCQGECEILIFTPIQSQPSPLSALSHTQDTGAGKLQCANKLGTQRKLRMSCDLMTTELFSHAGDTWVIVMIVIVMVMTVTRFSFPHKSRKLLVILSCFSLVTPVCPGRREWGR